MRGQLRQGDVLLVPVDELPAGARLRRDHAVAGHVVVAFGERTGHSHSLSALQAQLWEMSDGETVYLRIMETTALEHQEHAAIVVDRGMYRVELQRRYSRLGAIGAGD